MAKLTAFDDAGASALRVLRRCIGQFCGIDMSQMHGDTDRVSTLD
ncbi:MAG: hypothetical protein ACJAYX_004457 [Planctomycetota bacterium]